MFLKQDLDEEIVPGQIIRGSLDDLRKKKRDRRKNTEEKTQKKKHKNTIAKAVLNPPEKLPYVIKCKSYSVGNSPFLNAIKDKIAIE